MEAICALLKGGKEAVVCCLAECIWVVIFLKIEAYGCLQTVAKANVHSECDVQQDLKSHRFLKDSDTGFLEGRFD